MARRQIYVVPVDGSMVRSPRTMTLLPATGGWVPAENYWLRRIADGSVREAMPPEAKKETVVEDKRGKTKKEENDK